VPTEADLEFNRRIDEKYFDAIVAAADKGVDRARAASDTVQKAAAAIATIYTTLVAGLAAFDDRTVGLEWLTPTIFLATAIVASAAHAALLRRPQAGQPIEHDWPEDPQSRVVEHAQDLVQRRNRVALSGAHWLWVAVAALGIGVATLPLPLLQTSSDPAAVEMGTIRPRWPSPRGSSESAMELYKAQLTEVGEVRSQNITLLLEGDADKSSDGSEAALWALVLGLAIVCLAGLIGFRVARSTPTHGQTSES
jgi:hypothetical protein